MPKKEFLITTCAETRFLTHLFGSLSPKNYKYDSKTNTISFEIYGKMILAFGSGDHILEIKEFEK
jgi:hypothetical protein